MTIVSTEPSIKGGGAAPQSFATESVGPPRATIDALQICSENLMTSGQVIKLLAVVLCFF